jgi:hypothetical protein
MPMCGSESDSGSCPELGSSDQNEDVSCRCFGDDFEYELNYDQWGDDYENYGAYRPVWAIPTDEEPSDDDEDEPPLHSTWDSFFCEHGKPVHSAKPFKRPVGKSPKGKVWNGRTGVWDSAESPNVLSPEPTFRRPAGRPRHGHFWNSTTGQYERINEQVNEPASESTSAADADLRRMRTSGLSQFQQSWIDELPSLHMERIESCTRKQDCPGCPVCSRMYCQLCIDRGADNDWATCGSSNFHMKYVRAHRMCTKWHEFDFQPKDQTSVPARFANSIEEQSVHTRRIMTNVYGLGTEKIAMWKAPWLHALVESQGVALGKR